MSVQQEHDLRTGFSMFSGQTAQKTNLNGEENSNEQASPTKGSNSPSPVKNIQATPSSSSPSNVKLVGSNRLFMQAKK